jgi:excisionase family DNA binding protein
MLSTVEAADRLGVSRKSVNDYIISGKLKATKGKGNHNFVSEEDLQEFINNR